MQTRAIKYAHEIFKKDIAVLLLEQKITGALLEEPPENIDADLAMPTFSLAKKMKKAPAQIAQDLEKKIKVPKGSLVRSIRAVGPYLNFYKDNAKYTGIVLKNIITSKDEYGRKAPKKEKVMVEYSQANTHKAFHVGHVRGTSIGESLARIMRFDGYSVVQANYQGDTGAHVAKWLWCYQKYHKGETPPKKESERWLASIYVESVKKLAENPGLQNEVDRINRDLENSKDKKLKELWKKTRNWSLESLRQIYKDLDAHFDCCFFERQMEKRAKELSKELLDKGIAKKDDGATIIDFSKQGLGVWVLLRGDGTCLYSAKDIALAEKKFREFRVDRSIYVIGAAQSLHMKQLFKTLELMKFKNADKCYHLAFSEVRLPTGKMSSRTGENILYADMKKELFDYAREEVKKRHPEWNKKETEASTRNVSIGALKFGMLNQSANKLITFDAKEAMNFEGDTGPYIQYTHARADSILRKGSFDSVYDPSLLNEREEMDVVRKISYFPQTVTKACELYDPNPLTVYLLELSHDFNTFYHKYPVLKADSRLRGARLALVYAAMQVLKNGLYLLGITAPKKM
ncbi:MAG: arginine--tRNA ligase [archaeon]|nr:arginine--tRNA ligase [archaeon]